MSASPIPSSPFEDLSASAEIADARSVFRDTLAKIKAKRGTARLNEDSRLFKLSQKLTTIATEDDVERRRRMIAEAEEEETSAVASSSVVRRRG